MTEITFREAIREALREELQRDPTVFLIGEDIATYGGAFKVTEGLLDEFGAARVLDTPISEAALTGAAVGAAIVGTRPVLEIMFADFLTIAMDHLVNDAARTRYMYGGNGSAPLVVRTTVGRGAHFGLHHSQSVEGWFVHVPGLKIAYPSTPADAKGLLKTAIRDPDPVLFFEQQSLYASKGPVPDGEHLVPLGVADVKRSGSDATIVTFGAMVQVALGAAQELALDGVEVEVIDLRTLQPLDAATILESVMKTERLIIVHEAPKTGGVGAEIAALVSSEAFGYLDAPIQRLAAADAPVPFSPPLEEAFVPRIADIVQAVKETLPAA